jgi:hypothetical protein
MRSRLGEGREKETEGNEARPICCRPEVCLTVGQVAKATVAPTKEPAVHIRTPLF